MNFLLSLFSILGVGKNVAASSQLLSSDHWEKAGYSEFKTWCEAIPSIQGLDFIHPDELPVVPVPPMIFFKSLENGLVKGQYLNHSTMYHTIIDNPEFQRAINDCFPNDIKTQIYVVSAFAKYDVTGKVIAGVSSFGIFFSLGAILTKLGSAGEALWQLVNIWLTIEMGKLAIKNYQEYDRLKHPVIKLKSKIEKQDQILLERTIADIKVLKQMIEKDPNNEVLTNLLQESLEIYESFSD